MNALFRTVAISSALALPALALAQETNGPVTRDQVRNDLRQVEAAGYNPAGEDAQYPNDIQAAQARAQGMSGQTGIGGAQNGTSQSGRPMEPTQEAQPSTMQAPQ